MSGAASVVGAILGIATLKIPRNVVGLMPLVEKAHGPTYRRIDEWLGAFVAIKLLGDAPRGLNRIERKSIAVKRAQKQTTPSE